MVEMDGCPASQGEKSNQVSAWLCCCLGTGHVGRCSCTEGPIGAVRDPEEATCREVAVGWLSKRIRVFPGAGRWPTGMRLEERFHQTPSPRSSLPLPHPFLEEEDVGGHRSRYLWAITTFHLWSHMTWSDF